jgi:hypothetical protein
MRRALDPQITALTRIQHEASDAPWTGFEERRTAAPPSRVALRHKLVVLVLVALVAVWTLVLVQLAYQLLTRL